MTPLTKKLAVILADTYTLYLKTQNYHWHVKGPQFSSLHILFETQYRALIEHIDSLAERIVMKNEHAPATFSQFNELRTLKEGTSSFSANQMLTDLVSNHTHLIKELQAAITLAQEEHDEGTLTLLSEHIAAYEKNRWMLQASVG